MTTTAADLSADNESEAGTSLGWFLVGCLGQTDGLTQVTIGKVPFTVGRASSNDFTVALLLRSTVTSSPTFASVRR